MNIAWENRWMESMRGERWESLVKKYNTEFKKAVESVATNAEKKRIAKAFSDADLLAAADAKRTVGNGTIEITPGHALLFSWKSPLYGKGKAAALDCSSDGSLIATIEETSSEQYKCVVREKGRILWKSPGVAMEEVAVVGDTVYYIEQGDILLWRSKLWSYSVKTDEHKLLFEEKDRTYQLSLIKGHSHCLFLIRDNYKSQDLFQVKDVVYLLAKNGRYVPVGAAPDEPCYFELRRNEWVPVGPTLTAIQWPRLKNCAIEYIDLRRQEIVLRRMGIRTYYRKGHIVRQGFFSLVPGDDHLWQGGRRLRQPIVKKPDASVSYHTCKSKDGTRVPYVILSRASTPKGVIVYMYGAYNQPSMITTKKHWQPYLQSGWAIVVAMIRGGGDHTYEWSDEARTWRRERSVEDAEAVIHSARRILSLGPEATCIYGRSAGGYIIGALVNRHPGATLFGAVYLEAAFLDVLRTMSQPDLPAVVAESNEFGNPKRIEDLETLLRLSPVDNVPPGGVPALFLVARTALGDVEVYAYESVKWMERIRGGGGGGSHNALLHVGGKESGHFTESVSVYEEYAEDFLLLENWISRASASKKSHH
jgi:protease II